MNVITIQDLGAPGIEVFASLTEGELRKPGLFIAESPKVIRTALDAGYEAVSLLCEERHIGGDASDIVARVGDTPIYTGQREVLAAITGYTLTRGVLCAMRRKALPTVGELLGGGMLEGELLGGELLGGELLGGELLGGGGEKRLTEGGGEKQLLEGGGEKRLTESGGEKRLTEGGGEKSERSRICVLDNVCDTTNIGAIFRSAAALGIDAILLTPGTCDPLNRRSIRTSMGSVFLVPWTWLDTPVGSLRDYGYKTVAMALTDKSIPLDSAELKAEPRLAIIMGTEGDGLSDRVISAADYTVRIPMHHTVDSLNVAAASAVAFWELRKQ